MGRTWCRTDPTFKVNDKPLQLSILAGVPELKADHTFISFRTNHPVTIISSHGQAKKEIFGGPFTFSVNEYGDETQYGITVCVVTEDESTGAELVVTAHDQSGVFGHMIGVGYTDEDLVLETISD